MKKNSPTTILIKWRKAQNSSHHGGSWKIAYADFMTAMMAFFLVMWLLSTSTPQQREQIADYFRMPIKDNLNKNQKTNIHSIPMPENGGSTIQTEHANQRKEQELAHQKDIRRLNKTRYHLQQILKNDPRLRDFQRNMHITLVHEGLRIEIVDSKKRPMFTTGGKEIAPYMRYIMRIIAPVLNELPNRISLAGHTDNQPYINGERGYGNWELSADRANASRRELVEGGLMSDKILRVIGMANTMATKHKHSHYASQRRISIVILTQKQEAAIKKENSESHSEFIETNDDPASQLWKLAAPQAFTGKNEFQLKSNLNNFTKKNE
ncbi:MotB family proton-channel complex protein [Wigglesworthia glossinidia endosymbiont of Glossina morsitans morsitans (Yale colony)]|uniref:MotB family proton-channel complex protein n=1 Tax=Wigglesworthia glossinidia endosymbiont of Glossina morsitans morsitans (Yale colony) TaxID=1142511 RepID=H6Q4B4_WIGGL|nr:flagellar motor protein MotB [Wigglesworthia glossinidia]AFA40897.1 MotB family proton-channel complex protein [Wigglesworthia glossinidia endosymbiont of Glossina morsitans morsitans (Yale colony)]